MKKNNHPIINYDRESDVLALYLKKGIADNLLELSPGVAVEFGKDGSVVGIEILNASKVLEPFLKLAKKRVPLRVR